MPRLRLLVSRLDFIFSARFNYSISQRPLCRGCRQLYSRRPARKATVRRWCFSTIYFLPHM
jgi:hypothetical protein